MLPRQSQPHSSDRSRQLRRVILTVVYCECGGQYTLYIAVLTILAPSVTALHLQLQAILGLWIQSVALNGLNYSLFGITVKTEKKETEAVKSSEPQPQPSIEEKQTETTDATQEGEATGDADEIEATGIWSI
eukprot:34951_1